MPKKQDIFICAKCGKKSMSYSLITGKLDCGHSSFSKKEQLENKRLLLGLNKMVKEGKK